MNEITLRRTMKQVKPTEKTSEEQAATSASISYLGFETWDAFVSRYKNSSFSSPAERECFIQDFNSVSQLMWNSWLKNMSPDELSSQLSEAWFSPLEEERSLSPDQLCKAVLAHCSYASDRMNVNRWLRIRVLLNLIVE